MKIGLEDRKSVSEEAGAQQLDQGGNMADVSDDHEGLSSCESSESSSLSSTATRCAVSEHLYVRKETRPYNYFFVVSPNLPQIPYVEDVAVSVDGATVRIRVELTTVSADGLRTVNHKVWLEHTVPEDCDLRTLRAALTPDARIIMVASRSADAPQPSSEKCDPIS